MSVTTPFVLHLSDVRVEISVSLPEVRAALAAVWGSARALVPPRRTMWFEVREEGETLAEHLQRGASTFWTIYHEGAAVAATELREDVLALLEGALYARLPAWHSGYALLHAAGLVARSRPLILVGASGQGKSSLALAGVERGLGYLGDENVVTDGFAVWGIPRSIQFEPTPFASPMPARLAHAERESYRLRSDLGADCRLPLVPVAPEQVAGPVPTAGCVVALIERADDDLVTPCAPVMALAALHEASLGAASPSLARLVHPERCFKLRWADPGAALERLVAAIR